MKRIVIEVCCGSATDVFAAARAGADRAELNSALFFGGLTPSVGQTEEACAADIPVIAMIRPRQGGFVYDKTDVRAMLRDAAALRRAGAAGVAFGFLTAEGEIDRELCREMVDAAEGGETVFHRAFDMLGDNWRRSLDALMELGITRVLTSGFEPTAQAGSEAIRRMIAYVGEEIEILPGGGVREGNARAIIEATGCKSLHTSARAALTDASVRLNPRVSFNGHVLPSEDEYFAQDEKCLRGFMEAMRNG